MKLAVDTPVAPGRILAVETQDQSANLSGCPRSPWRAAGGLGPVTSDEPAVPSQHRCRLHDQEHLPETVAIEHLRQHAQHRTVPAIEGWTRHLPLQHQQLVTQGEYLCIATITARQQQTDTSHDETNNERQRPKHDRARYPWAAPDQPRRVSGTLTIVLTNNPEDLTALIGESVNLE